MSGSLSASARATMQFQTPTRYTDRASKGRYVWEKYGSLLESAHILDVGADECHLRRHLPSSASYWGIGFGQGVDEEVDLEAGSLRFADREFDCVLCLDVLEHLESAHRIFDEIFRIASQHVIISLPNPWASFWNYLRGKSNDRSLKFYGFPTERPDDRHRWFFSATQAADFMRARAAANGWSVVQIDYGWPADRAWQRRLQRRKWLQRLGWLPPVPLEDLYAGHVWGLFSLSSGQVKVA